MSMTALVNTSLNRLVITKESPTPTKSLPVMGSVMGLSPSKLQYQGQLPALNAGKRNPVDPLSRVAIVRIRRVNNRSVWQDSMT